MGVVTLPSSASHISTKISLRLKLGPSARTNRPGSTMAFKSDRTKCSAVVASKSTAQVPVPVERLEKERAKVGKRRSEKRKEEQQEGSLDYNEVAAALENIYKQSAVREDNVVRSRKSRRKRRNIRVEKRLSDQEEEEEKLIREYSVSSNDLVSMDWKKMKIPPVLSMPEQRKLFKFMQPMKEILELKEKLQIDLKKEVTDGELASAVNMTVPQLRRRVKVGQAARNKLIKHNLRLVIFAINKYYQDMASGDKFQDLCQAGVKGLITAIDRFEHKRGFRLSTYALFWIRHSIVRSMTTSSFTRVSFGIESVRQEIQKAKLELICELDRMPTEEEILSRVGISAERYYDVTRASKTVYSLNSRHIVTQEEFINQISDVDADVGGDKRRQPALLRLALDDVLDSLKPKESLVIRQRYGLDGKGDRTLGEIAGNLNISREMVRKHELKALMKLKNPARLDYLRRHI